MVAVLNIQRISGVMISVSRQFINSNMSVASLSSKLEYTLAPFGLLREKGPQQENP